eukprot:TRINITY_DN20864_c0_g1_i1.p1 TRINITY_DN20864_c0_g1~~TRINITY_DN20864_c0_g1_i1.p1  ORF type:complete len:704 (+),score=135.45 TRINITY_DN20864_c0_g1_i1:60-2114(+)
MGEVQWRWGDAGYAGLASLNPLRWSKVLTLQSAISCFQKHLQTDAARPVKLRSIKPTKSDVDLPDVAAAIEWLSAIMIVYWQGVFQQVSQQKALDFSTQRGYSFLAMKKHADLELGQKTREEIQKDIPRTLAGIPASLRPGVDKKLQFLEKTSDILMAFEWHIHNTKGKAQGAGGASYTQGMNFLAAMCLSLCQSNDEAGFYLFARLAEDVLTLDYFRQHPPLLGPFADSAALRLLVQQNLPAAVSAAGEELESLMSSMTVKLFVPCFAGLDKLQDAVLFRIWGDLLMQPFHASGRRPFPRLPLFTWAIGLLGMVDASKVGLLLSRDELDRLLSSLPADWTPPPVEVNIQEVMDVAAAEMQRLVQEADRRSKLSPQSIPSFVVREIQKELLASSQTEMGGVSINELNSALRRLAPACQGDAAQLFNLLDKGCEGRLDFFEVMTVLTMLIDGPWHSKLHMLFELYDTDESGILDEAELECLATCIAKIEGSDLLLGTLHDGLDLAKFNEWPKLFKMLDRQGELVNLRPAVREYAIIHQAVYCGDLDIVTQLLDKYGADINLQTKSGKTAIDIAIDQGHSAIAAALTTRLDESCPPATSASFAPRPALVRSSSMKAVPSVPSHLRCMVTVAFQDESSRAKKIVRRMQSGDAASKGGFTLDDFVAWATTDAAFTQLISVTSAAPEGS